MFRNSLRTRIVFAFGLFAALLGIAGGLGAFGAARVAEDRVLQRQLRLAVVDYMRRSGDDPDAALPRTLYLQSYRDPARLPEPLREWSAGIPDDGYYEFPDDDLHVAVITSGVPPRSLYVVADVSGIEASATEELWWSISLISIVATFTLLAIIVGVGISRRAVDPVVRLAEMVAGINSDKLSDDDWRRIQSERFQDNEVGLLARTIERALQRICAFIERERYFTSSASHELRTPLTVISGALDLLERPGLSKNASRVVGRIRRATVEMQATIEMFLSLSRETADSSRREHFEVAPLIEQAIERQRHLLADKQIDIDVVRSADPCLFGDPQAFAVAVSNLVRNAFEHTPHDKGPVEVRIGEYQVSVSNHSGLDADDAVELSTQLSRRGVSQGFGLGLGIVQRLCENNGWTFTLNVNQGAVDARLAWAASGSRAAVK